MPYIKPTTKEVVPLTGTLGEQNLAANRMGLDYVPPAPVSSTPTAPANMSIGAANQAKGLNPDGTPIVPAPTDATTADKTIAESGVRRYPGIAPVAGTYEAEATKLAARAGAPVQTEDQIREQMRQRVQEQIDAIKNTYAGLISKEQERGVGRLGQTRAAGARSGILGQDFGIAEMGKTEQLNAEQIQALANQRDLQITGILGKIDQEAYTRAQKEIEKGEKTSEEYMSYLKESRDQSRTDAQNLAKSGASLEQLSDEQYKKLLDASGYTPEQMKALFVMNKPEDKVLTSFTQGNQFIRVIEDPITKKRTTEKIDLGFTVPAGYKEQKLNDETMIFYPEKFDPTKSIKDQILEYKVSGGPSLDTQKKQLEIENQRLQNQKLMTEIAGGEKAIKSGTLTYSANDKSDDSTALENSRGDDGWVDPTIYQTLYKQWTNEGGLIKDFLKEFPPTLYVNPANDWLPSYLRPKTKTESESPY